MRDLAALTFVTLDGVMQAPSDPEEGRSGGFEQGTGFAGVLGEDGSPLLRESVTGYTDGTPLGRHRFIVRQPRYVEVEAPDAD